MAKVLSPGEMPRSKFFQSGRRNSFNVKGLTRSRTGSGPSLSRSQSLSSGALQQLGVDEGAEVRAAAEQKVAERLQAWHYAEGLASGLAEHLERQTAQAPSSEAQRPPLALIVGLGAVACAEVLGPPLPLAGEICSLAQAAFLGCLARVAGPWTVQLAWENPSSRPYAELLDGLRPYAELLATGVLCVALQVGGAGSRLQRCALALVVSSLLAAGKWLLECFYSTRLLKLRCGGRVTQNAWERQVLERLRSAPPSPSPDGKGGAGPPPLMTAGGLWEFDLACLELIRSQQRAAADSPKRDSDAPDAAEDAEEEAQEEEEEDAAVAVFRGLVAAKEGQRLGALPEGADGDIWEPALQLEDIRRFLPEPDAKRAWAWLWGDGGAGAGDWLWSQGSDRATGIREDVFVQRVLRTRTETSELVSNICEYKTIFALFRQIVSATFGVALAVMLLAVFWPEALSSLWWSFSSVIVAASFIFGPLMRDALESLTLILIIRPFDVGDRVIVNDQRMLVVELQMLTTTFLNGYNELIWVRNSRIFAGSAQVCNLSRSEHAECGVEIDIMAEDSIPANIQLLEQAVRKWCQAHEDTWLAEECGAATVTSGGSNGVLCSMADCGPGIVRWRFRAVHKLNLQQPFKVRVDTSQLMAHLIEQCGALGVRLRKPPAPVRLVD